jgi:ketosteroid isomerase-like protein
MSSNKALIESFYAAFKNKDFKAMAECYHDDVYFRDEAFELKGKQVGAMWHMLCERGADMELTYSVAEQDGKVTAHWEPKYSFSQTGRFVHNIIDAEFEFKEGKIVKHIDQFDFWRWSRQSLGIPGLVLGWSSSLKKKVSTMANKALVGFIKKHPEYEG